MNGGKLSTFVWYFNPRSREGSDSSALDPQDTLLLFQSTLPRRERQKLPARMVPFRSISIHAPAKGATIHQSKSTHYCIISIHAPAKGATGKGSVSISITLRISIHAPAKGATIAFSLSSKDIAEFQSTLPRRERLCQILFYNQSYQISIHAPAKGATNFPLKVSASRSNFNPRSREGSDAEYYSCNFVE